MSESQERRVCLEPGTDAAHKAMETLEAEIRRLIVLLELHPQDVIAVLIVVLEKAKHRHPEEAVERVVQHWTAVAKNSLKTQLVPIETVNIGE